MGSELLEAAPQDFNAAAVESLLSEELTHIRAVSSELDGRTATDELIHNTKDLGDGP